MAVQAQQRQGYDQRASGLIPISGTLLVALASAVFAGDFKPVGNATIPLWLMVGSLLLGMILCFGFLVRPPGQFAGMEPEKVMQGYASEAGEHGVLKAVSDEYQRRIESNRVQLARMSKSILAVNFLVLLGVLYGAQMVYENRNQTAPPGSAAPQAPTPAP